MVPTKPKKSKQSLVQVGPGMLSLLLKNGIVKKHPVKNYVLTENGKRLLNRAMAFI